MPISKEQKIAALCLRLRKLPCESFPYIYDILLDTLLLHTDHDKLMFTTEEKEAVGSVAEYVGMIIKKLRKRSDVSQKQLSLECGMKLQDLKKLENGTLVSFRSLDQILNYLQVCPKTLIRHMQLTIDCTSIGLGNIVEEQDTNFYQAIYDKITALHDQMDPFIADNIQKQSNGSSIQQFLLYHFLIILLSDPNFDLDQEDDSSESNYA